MKDMDDKMLNLLLEGKIDPNIFTDYWCSDARQHHVYIPTFLSTIRNNLYSLFAN